MGMSAQERLVDVVAAAVEVAAEAGESGTYTADVGRTLGAVVAKEAVRPMGMSAQERLVDVVAAAVEVAAEAGESGTYTADVGRTLGAVVAKVGARIAVDGGRNPRRPDSYARVRIPRCPPSPGWPRPDGSGAREARSRRRTGRGETRLTGSAGCPACGYLF
ncbi:hypothetical protein A8W25_18125 [Streptomyces sp. ERV7]|uniref:hypothetical protein n=1 Tax=Streptomyces sp. ERV7 TaxID=1322334 RepID=UPI0007F4B58D|nr:hypothetical protein [Streptomyces sp. ERV7]OAR24332.1 hypothetical protein A8W25_18125 [Streptomyces sp. ERV7]